MDIDEFRGDIIHPNSKVKNFRWLMSDYDGSTWLFHVAADKAMYFTELEEYHTLQSAKNSLISRDNVSKDGEVDNDLYIRDIKDARSETFYEIRALKYTLERL